MKLDINWNENFQLEKLVSLKETLATICHSFGKSQVWLEDLCIYMGYPYEKNHPSVRICRLLLRKPLRDLGIKADIVFRYEDVEPYHHIMISHFDGQLASYCDKWRRQGKRVYYSHTEALWGLSEQEKVFNLCDYIVCCSNKLVELTQPNLSSNFTQCYFIPDMAEEPTSPNSKLHTPQNTQPLKIVYVGMGGNSYMAHNLRPLIEELGMSLTVISEWDNADIKWDRDTYLDIMSQHDIAICPQNVVQQPAKSHIKVATAMSRGLPVICSPNPAYLEIVKHGVNGFIADSPEQWREALLKLKDFELRKQFNAAALKTAQQFTPHAIALRWLELLTKKRFTVGLVNNTLRQKYLSYGDAILEDLRFNGYDVEEFRYEDIDRLPAGLDAYLFIEERYDAEDIAAVHPRILLTKEQPDINVLAQFDVIVANSEALVSSYQKRGFVNVFYQPTFDMKQIIEWTKVDLTKERKKHNEQLHSLHIDAFHHLQQPETRWDSSHIRDNAHIKYTMTMTQPGENILDIASADGWLALYLAKNNRHVSALEFVERGIEWTHQHAQRLNVSIDLRKGFIEDVDVIFKEVKFNTILIYELLEHLDFLKLPWYLEKIEKLLLPEGKVLISLPCQNMLENDEHLWSPNEKLINKIFSLKNNYKLSWVPMEHNNVPGNWFISYQKN